MCEQLRPYVAPTSIWENFWKINFQWNLFFSWYRKPQYKPIWFSTIWLMCKPVAYHNSQNIFFIWLESFTRGSLDIFSISKAFDKAWHEGLLYKLKSFGISRNLLNLFKHYLTDRSERVLLNGQYSNWQPIIAGVPQGSSLGPLLFLRYINDLPDGLKSSVRLFADDTLLNC